MGYCRFYLYDMTLSHKTNKLKMFIDSTFQYGFVSIEYVINYSKSDVSSSLT